MSSGYTKEDALTRSKVLERDRGRCRAVLLGCGGAAVDVHHIYGRSVLELRHDPDNLLGLCRNCHKRIESEPDGGNEMCFRFMDGDTRARLEQKAKKALGTGMW